MHEISYMNAILYSHVIPIPNEDSKTPDNDAPIYDDSKDACNDIDLTGIDEDIIAQYNDNEW